MSGEWKDMIKISAALPVLDQSAALIPDEFNVVDDDIEDLQNTLDAAHLVMRNYLTNKVLKYKQLLISSSDRRYTALLDDLRSDKERLVKDNGLLHSKLVDIQHKNEALIEKNHAICINIMKFYQRGEADGVARLFMQRLTLIHENAKYNKRLAAIANRKRIHQLKKSIFSQLYKHSVNSKYAKRFNTMKSKSEQTINDLQSRLELQERLYQQKIIEDKLLYDRECQRHASIEEELKSKVLNTLTNLKLDALSVFANKETDNEDDALITHQTDTAYRTPIKKANKNLSTDESPLSVVLGHSSVNNTPKSISYRSHSVGVTSKRIIGRK